MCNINVAYRKDGKNCHLIKEYMNFASYNSYYRNNDADGYFAFKGDRYFVNKSIHKIKVEENCWFVCSHQRLATSGKPEESIHPFETDDFILVHNGVFDNMGDWEKSDTREFVGKLQSNYKGNMIEAIQETTKQVSGRFSIVVYDKNEDRVYYFKESGTDMYVVENDDYLFMSTIEENLEYACYMFDIDKEEIKEVTENLIIDVLAGFEEVGTFEEKKNDWYGTYNSKNRTKWDWSEEETEEEDEDDETPVDLGVQVEDKRKKIPELYYEYSSDRQRYLTVDSKPEYPKGDWRNDEKICKELKTEQGGFVKWL